MEWSPEKRYAILLKYQELLCKVLNAHIEIRIFLCAFFISVGNYEICAVLVCTLCPIHSIAQLIACKICRNVYMPASCSNSATLLYPLDSTFSCAVLPAVKGIVVHKVKASDSRIFSARKLCTVIKLLIVVIILIIAVLLIVSISSLFVRTMPVELISVLVDSLAVTVNLILLAVAVNALILCRIVTNSSFNAVTAAVDFLLSRKHVLTVNAVEILHKRLCFGSCIGVTGSGISLCHIGENSL